MCKRDRPTTTPDPARQVNGLPFDEIAVLPPDVADHVTEIPVSYTHLRAHETVLDLVCRLLLEKKKTTFQHTTN